ncbi:tRNA (adenosine(37)-N6)-dimethylallyltransferase MiaA [Salinimicrobium sp. GXAS 041]|uniref:tRNA (adenosine(37)-N6)-dimethylallyltransferase MiaA n=1 Tax=Salinimicrobium sp. GXAS 041 TaxID=3400806 RepID=UPI003C72E785
MNKHLISVVGPTAIGKTAMAIEIARHYNCEIISADSRQFFKEMSIGTAVPSEAELKAAKHHFIQNISVEEDYSVGDFERDAIEKLKEIYKQNNIAVMAGGSGLYVKAVTEGLDHFPEVDSKIREQLNEELLENGIFGLQQKLQELDPVYYSKVDKENPHRIIRALEVCLQSGKPYSAFRNQQKTPRTFHPIFVGLTSDREVIYDRINQRVDLMMKEGLLEEVKKLYPKRALNALNTVGYKELFQFLEGNFTLEEAVAEIKKNTRRFAKRQLTWFRKQPEIKWFDYQTPAEEIMVYLESKTHG